MEITRLLEDIKDLNFGYEEMCKKLTTERKYSEDLQSQLTTTKEALKEAIDWFKDELENGVGNVEFDDMQAILTKLEEGL